MPTLFEAVMHPSHLVQYILDIIHQTQVAEVTKSPGRPRFIPTATYTINSGDRMLIGWFKFNDIKYTLGYFMHLGLQLPYKFFLLAEQMKHSSMLASAEILFICGNRKWSK